MPKAIVITIDQLGARYLSPYGNTWNPTPGFDQLAATSLTMEFCLSSSTDLDQCMTSMLSGKHPLATSTHVSLLQQLQKDGQSSVLIQEGDSLSSIPICQQFSEVHSVPFTKAGNLASSIEDTSIAQFTGLTLDLIEQQLNHDLIWIHHAGLGASWDAPMQSRERYFGEEDPEIKEISLPPFGPLNDPNDPDEIMQNVHAYAAQVSVLDTCLGLLIEQLKEEVSGLDEQVLLIVTAPRCLPLGHHGGVGVDHSLPGTDQLHVPMFLSRLDNSASVGLSRNTSLCQTESVYSTLSQWFEQPDSNNPHVHQSLLDHLQIPGTPYAALSEQCTVSIFPNGSTAIHTPAWFSVQSTAGQTQLWVKPDDRWESNQIGSRRQDIVAEFESLFERSTQIATEPISLAESLQKQLLR